MAEQTEAQRQAEQRRQDEQRQAEERRHDEMHRQAQARSQEGQERTQGRAAERQQDAPLRQRPPDERPRDESTIDRQELLRREQTPPPPPVLEPPPDPLLVMDPVLRDSLEALDRDVSGEIRFCRQAAESLRAFQYRWSTDAPVEDGYGKAIQALENMDSILHGAEIRTTEEVTRKVLGRLGAAQQAEMAETAREHAVQWANTPPTPQEAKAREAERAKRPVPPEAGVVA